MVEIKTLYVRVYHIHRGIGRAFLAAALARCEALDHSRLWLAVNANIMLRLIFIRHKGFRGFDSAILALVALGF